MTEKNYRSKIAEEALTQIRKGRLLDFSLDEIADSLKLPIEEVHSYFETEQDLVLFLGENSIQNHKKKSEQIVKIPGPNALSTMLRHDLRLISGFRMYADKAVRKKFKKSVKRMNDYLINEIAQHYFEILRRNLSLMPDREIDIGVYSHFIVHSLYFFERNQMSDLTNEEVDSIEITKKIISILFRENQLDLEESNS